MISSRFNLLSRSDAEAALVHMSAAKPTKVNKNKKMFNQMLTNSNLKLNLPNKT